MTGKGPNQEKKDHIKRRRTRSRGERLDHEKKDWNKRGTGSREAPDQEKKDPARSSQEKKDWIKR